MDRTNESFGEKNTAESIQYFEVAEKDNSVIMDDLIPIIELPEYVEWKKSKIKNQNQPF